MPPPGQPGRLMEGNGSGWNNVFLPRATSYRGNSPLSGEKKRPANSSCIGGSMSSVRGSPQVGRGSVAKRERFAKQNISPQLSRWFKQFVLKVHGYDKNMKIEKQPAHWKKSVYMVFILPLGRSTMNAFQPLGRHQHCGIKQSKWRIYTHTWSNQCAVSQLSLISTWLR